MEPLWYCDEERCQLPAVQREGDCVLCGKHLCRVHVQDEWQKCPKPESNWKDYSAQYAAGEAQRLAELCRKIDGERLCARASHMRNMPCAMDLSPKTLSAMMGGQNCHADITFADGVVWIVRFRLSSPISPPPQVRDYVLQSEAATMIFLERHTSIPSPRVFDWACESDPENLVGVGYILMEKPPGKPLDWQDATAAQKRKVVQQLADVMFEIEKHPFDQLGSLINTTAGFGGPVEMRGLAQHSTSTSSEGGKPLGPFDSSQEAFRALVEAHLQMIAAGEVGTAGIATDVFLAHRFRLDLLDRVWAQNPTGSKEGEKFFLKHADDKGDHILVNDDFDIVGIIDWECCSTTSKEEAFSSPCMMWPVGAFYDGSNELAEEELFLASVFRDKGRNDLARCVLNGRKVQRMLFALGPVGASHQDSKTFASLFMGLKRAFEGEHGTDKEKLGAEEEEWETWKASALQKWKHDTRLQAVLGSK